MLSGRSVIAGLACVGLLSACGSTAKPAASSFHSDAVAFSSCMRAHGLANFPDPTAGGGIHIDVSSGLDPSSPAFKVARAACRHLLPGGGPGAQRPSARDRAAMLATAECMRSHGVTGFPDPTLTPPANPAGYSLLQNRGGVIIAIPNTINVQSPVFRQAAASCGFH